MAAKGRILSIDYGAKNIGLACSDELRLTVRPLPSIPNRGLRDFCKKLRFTIRTMDVQEIVLGMPLNMNGTRGDSVLRMEQLMETLRESLDIPLHGIDERLSTVEAMEYWGNMGLKQQRKYRSADSLAAALILERYLKET